MAKTQPKLKPADWRPTTGAIVLLRPLPGLGYPLAENLQPQKTFADSWQRRRVGRWEMDLLLAGDLIARPVAGKSNAIRRDPASGAWLDLGERFEPEPNEKQPEPPVDGNDDDGTKGKNK